MVRGLGLGGLGWGGGASGAKEKQLSFNSFSWAPTLAFEVLGIGLLF